jgi:hypothetical protein
MKDFRTELKRNKWPFFKSLRAGDYILSIQASEAHYCTPREDGLNGTDYTHFELAIFDQDDNWVNPFFGDTLYNFDRYDELMEHCDGNSEGSTWVFGWLPYDLIDDLIYYLKTI